jgi:hypothetical protein
MEQNHEKGVLGKPLRMWLILHSLHCKGEFFVAVVPFRVR